MHFAQEIFNFICFFKVALTKSWQTQLSNKMENKLLTLDAIYVSSVLEDCVDQLAILGKIMPSSLEGRPDAEQVTDS
jgi:hypothetical protein